MQVSSNQTKRVTSTALVRLAVAGATVAVLSLGAVSAGATVIAVMTPKPVLTMLKPSSGYAGQSITIVGKNFHSNNGVIFATFGSRGTYTHCPTRQTCIVLVPKGLTGTQMVRLHTQTAVSNALSFRYTK